MALEIMAAATLGNILTVRFVSTVLQIVESALVLARLSAHLVRLDFIGMVL